MSFTKISILALKKNHHQTLTVDLQRGREIGYSDSIVTNTEVMMFKSTKVNDTHINTVSTARDRFEYFPQSTCWWRIQWVSIGFKCLLILAKSFFSAWKQILLPPRSGAHLRRFPFRWNWISDLSISLKILLPIVLQCKLLIEANSSVTSKVGLSPQIITTEQYQGQLSIRQEPRKTTQNRLPCSVD